MSEPIRVLHLIKTLSLGGAETNLLNLALAFDPARVETHVGYSYGGEIEPRFRAAGVRLFKYADKQYKVKSPASLAIAWRIARYIKLQRIDVVHTHNFNAHIWGLLAAKLSGIKLVEHVHDFRYTPTDELLRRHGFMSHYRFMRWFRHAPDRVVVLTHAHRDFVVREKIADAARVVKIPNGIPMASRRVDGRAIRRELDIPDDAFVVLTSARMDPTKNIELVVRVADAVAAAVPNALFVIAGEGPHRDAYEALAREYQLDAHVRFIGFHADVDALLAAADVYLLPSFLELHSIAILEATRRGVPIVVSDEVGSHDEFVVDGTTGYLCDPFEDARWITVIVRLARDPALRRRIGLAGQETCRRLFDIATTARRFEELYRTLLSIRAEGPRTRSPYRRPTDRSRS